MDLKVGDICVIQLDDIAIKDPIKDLEGLCEIIGVPHTPRHPHPTYIVVCLNTTRHRNQTMYFLPHQLIFKHRPDNGS